MKVRKALRVTDWTEVVEVGESWEKEVMKKYRKIYITYAQLPSL